MKLLKNLDYKTLSVSLSVLALVSNMQVDEGIKKNYCVNNFDANYKKYDYVAFGEENTKEKELSILLSQIESLFNASIEKYWIPANGLLEKVCLFIKFENQECLEQKYEDLELSLYESLKDFLENSEYFEMVALL